jgi:hypothetical protein
MNFFAGKFLISLLMHINLSPKQYLTPLPSVACATSNQKTKCLIKIKVTDLEPYLLNMVQSSEQKAWLVILRIYDPI